MIRALTTVLLAAMLAACGAPQNDEAAAQGFEPAASPLPGLLDDVGALAQPDNDARRDALIALLERDGFSPRTFEFPNESGDGSDTRAAGRNVIVSIGDGEPAIVAGAHFDATFDGDGMVDNAAGTVVVLRAARALRELGVDGRIDFVFFDMEEIGLVGSRRYARALPEGSVAAMVNVDVAAYGDTVFFGHTEHGHERLYAALARVCGAQRIACIDFPKYPPTDNLGFEAAGIPNVSLSVLPRAQVHQLWLFMNAGPDAGLADGFVPDVFRAIHSERDVLEAVDPAAMTLAYNALVPLLLELARIPR